MKTTNKLYFVFISGILLLFFNFPFIEIANKRLTYQGIPVLYVYISVVWIISIFLLYYLSKKLFKSTKENE